MKIRNPQSFFKRLVCQAQHEYVTNKFKERIGGQPLMTLHFYYLYQNYTQKQCAPYLVSYFLLIDKIRDYRIRQNASKRRRG